MKKSSGGKAVRYNKWGYIFLIPFIVVFVIFQLVPLVNTIYNSFFENYMSGLTQVGPTFVGLDYYKRRCVGILQEHDGSLDHVFHSTDFLLITAWCLVLRCAVETERCQIH